MKYLIRVGPAGTPLHLHTTGQAHCPAIARDSTGDRAPRAFPVVTLAGEESAATTAMRIYAEHVPAAALCSDCCVDVLPALAEMEV